MRLKKVNLQMMNTCLTLQSCVSKELVKENCPGKESSVSEEDASRIGNTLWCSCGKHRPMANHAESICCLHK